MRMGGVGLAGGWAGWTVRWCWCRCWRGASETKRAIERLLFDVLTCYVEVKSRYSAVRFGFRFRFGDWLVGSELVCYLSVPCVFVRDGGA